MLESPAIHILKTCVDADYSTHDLLRKLRRNYETSHQNVMELKNMGLIEITTRKNMRGRPNKIVSVTALGKAFLVTSLKNNSKCLQLTDDNIRKAVHHAAFVKSLKTAGINPYDRLIEMNEIALAIRGSA